ncbi:putative sodium-coupled neutral amino acid transporter 10 [Paramacrobiotus metropolitanus]|uniref:putative sodium-coupled neutral amino acid transporter 10 n=1 Tax=Paramacrobiotus metropolitanus TaxID=2943436 RepID=UPI00244593D6|nr:putative sodium-coupled neutral amino acid transporter 10 [Paramacrobiotus metropolitanus]
MIPVQLFKSSSDDMPFVINMANSIIGVSILAMPWSFREVGIVLGSMLLVFGGLLTKWSCRLLLAAAAGPPVNRSMVTGKRTSSFHLVVEPSDDTLTRSSYEYLALSTFGKWGKLLVELSTIGYLLGSCVAFLVVMGDLLPEVAGKIISPVDSEAGYHSQSMRAFFLTVVALCIALPLSLMQKVENLVSLSAFSIFFYVFLVAKVFVDAVLSSSWPDCMDKLILWRFRYVLPVLPIFTTGLSCQTQVFVMYESLTDPSCKRMNAIISDAVNLCFVLYWSVGFFGYLAFCNTEIRGDVLLNFENTWLITVIRCLYIVAAAISFPLCIFPSRRSVETLLFHQETATTEGGAIQPNTSKYFRTITIILVTCTLIASIIIPNIETILNLSGSTMGALICFILPGSIALRSGLMYWPSISDMKTLGSYLQDHLTALIILLVGAVSMGVCLWDVLLVLVYPPVDAASNPLLIQEEPAPIIPAAVIPNSNIS